MNELTKNPEESGYEIAQRKDGKEGNKLTTREG